MKPWAVCAHGYLLNNGQVWIAAGTGARQRAELYDPTSGTFSNRASLNVGRTDDSAVLLENGQAMAVGGYNGMRETYGLSRALSSFTEANHQSVGVPAWRPRSRRYGENKPFPSPHLSGLTVKEWCSLQLFFEVTA